ncbi:MAG TPA: pyridoxamine 5'-phosphate oxidase family protein, partial [Candidatus Dormibacteraeota bacterium]|nr:pyridoxamine 5'-phosphate oxidase family protein [Candidatus Dormibacteraeota bacterium]
MTVERRARRFTSRRLEQVARRLMAAAPLCALATVSAGGRAHINHMYFAWNDRYDVFWYSDRDSIHSRNLARTSSAAITIYDS